jgi:acyl transferase domain-containing protein
MEINDIAIIGMAGVFPGACNVQQYWENILHKVNAISGAPPEWEAGLFFEENTKADDRTYCKRGGFLGKLAQFDPFSFGGIMPNGALDLEPVKQRTSESTS